MYFPFPGALSPEDRWGQVNLSIQGTHKAPPFRHVSRCPLWNSVIWRSKKRNSNMIFNFPLWFSRHFYYSALLRPRVILPVKCDAGTTGVTQTALSSLPEVSSCSGADARSCCCHCLEQRAAVVPGQTACLLIASGQGALQTPGVTPPSCSCWVCTPLLESLQLSMQHKLKFALGAFPPNTALGHTEAFSILQGQYN